MTNVLRRFVTASVLSALVLSAAAPANASLKQGKRFAPARVHHAKLPVHHVLGASVVPSTPAHFGATAGDQRAVFTWFKLNNATRYVVMLRPNNASCVTVSTSCAVRGLANGTLYSATVVAVNSAGRSAPSATRTITPVAVRPSAPRSVNAVAFGLHALVTWLPVTGLSNPVTRYIATSTPGHLICPSLTTTCVVSDLEAGVSYTFTVTATNAVGTSPDSLPSPSVAIVNRPDAPTSVILAPSPDSIGVSWQAPVSDGGLAIDSYNATAYLASNGAPVAHCRISGATTCEIAGLSTATSYAVRVTAHNTMGYSIASGTAGPVLTGYNPPGQPLSVSVVGALESLTIDWLAPSSDGGGVITRYTATADAGPGGLFTCTTIELTCTISGLFGGLTYWVTVVATNGAGDSVISEPISGTPSTSSSVPDAPTDLVVTPGNGEATVTWIAPIFVGSSGVTNYTVTAADGDGGVFTCSTANTACTINGLTNGTNYTITVVATNSAGDSLSSAPINATPTSPPDAPTNVRATAGDTSLYVIWDWPGDDTNVTSYLVTAQDDHGNSYTCSAGPGISSWWSACTINGLTNGTNYTITVVATNSAGDSLSSAPINATPTSPPDAPTNASAVTFTPDYWYGTVSWTLPETNTARYWRVEAWTTDSNGEPYLATALENWDPNGTSMTIYSLDSGHQYGFILYAINQSSVYSSGVNFAGTSLDPFPAISNANVTVLGNAVVGLWNVSEAYGPVAFTRMEIYTADGTYIATCSDYSGTGDGKTCWTSGLALSTDYYAVIQGYGYYTGWGGGVRLEFTTAAEYAPSNFYNATNTDGYTYSAAATPDGSFWYSSSSGVHHVVNGVDTTVDVSAYLPAHVGLSQMTGLANNGVAFSTNGYDHGWLDTGILYIAPDGSISYLAAGATTSASTIVPFGDHSVVVTNVSGLTVINLDTGDFGPLPGLNMYDQMYARIIPATNGVVYFLDRSNSLLLHRYDGSANGSPVYTDVELSGNVGDSAVIIDNVLYSFTGSIFTTTNLVTGVVTLGLNFSNVIEIPRLLGVTASGDLLAAASYTFWTVAAQHSTLPLG